MNSSVILVFLTLALSTSYGAVIKQQDFIELCEATGKLMFSGLSPTNVQQAIKQKSELALLQRPDIARDDDNDVGDNTNSNGDSIFLNVESKVIDLIVSLFIDGIARLTKETSSLPTALASDVQSLQSNGIKSFCSQLPIPESVDTDNPVTTLTAIINYVNSLTPNLFLPPNSNLKNNDQAKLSD